MMLNVDEYYILSDTGAIHIGNLLDGSHLRDMNEGLIFLIVLMSSSCIKKHVHIITYPKPTTSSTCHDFTLGTLIHWCILQGKMIFVDMYPTYALSSSFFQKPESDCFWWVSVSGIQLSIVASRRDNKLILGHDHPPVIWEQSSINEILTEQLTTTSQRALCCWAETIHPTSTQCLKITEKVSFKIASEASYFYILRR